MVAQVSVQSGVYEVTKGRIVPGSALERGNYAWYLIENDVNDHRSTGKICQEHQFAMQTIPPYVGKGGGRGGDTHRLTFTLVSPPP